MVRKKQYAIWDSWKKLPVRMGSWLINDGVCVWGACPDGLRANMDRAGVITETRVSKLRGLIPETWHFQVALIWGYHINLTLLSERLHGRKWVEGRDLESTSQTSTLANAHKQRESHKVSPHSRSLGVPDGPRIRADGSQKSLKTPGPVFTRATDWCIRNTATVAGSDHTPVRTHFFPTK